MRPTWRLFVSELRLYRGKEGEISHSDVRLTRERLKGFLFRRWLHVNYVGDLLLGGSLFTALRIGDLANIRYTELHWLGRCASKACPHHSYRYAKVPRPRRIGSLDPGRLKLSGAVPEPHFSTEATSSTTFPNASSALVRGTATAAAGTKGYSGSVDSNPAAAVLKKKTPYCGGVISSELLGPGPLKTRKCIWAADGPFKTAIDFKSRGGLAPVGDLADRDDIGVARQVRQVRPMDNRRGGREPANH
jgi:hypothetical protein